MKDERGKEILIPRSDIPQFLNAAFWAAWEFYAQCRMMAELGAAPFSGGWTSWPEDDVRILITLKSEEDRCERETIDRGTG